MSQGGSVQRGNVCQELSEVDISQGVSLREAPGLVGKAAGLVSGDRGSSHAVWLWVRPHPSLGLSTPHVK